MDENFIIRIGTELEKEQMLKDYPYMRDVIRKDGYFLVAKNDDTIVGCLWAFKRDIPAPIEQNEIFINMIEVTHSNLRCKGIATAMLKEIIKIAKNENVYQVRAYCDIRNIPSHRLWLKNKFSISPVKMPDDTIAGSFVSCVL